MQNDWAGVSRIFLQSRELHWRWKSGEMLVPSLAIMSAISQYLPFGLLTVKCGRKGYAIKSPGARKLSGIQRGSYVRLRWAANSARFIVASLLYMWAASKCQPKTSPWERRAELLWLFSRLTNFSTGRLSNVYESLLFSYSESPPHTDWLSRQYIRHVLNLIHWVSSSSSDWYQSPWSDLLLRRQTLWGL